MAEAAIARADELHAAKQYEALFNFLKESQQQFPNDIELTWRLCRAYFDMSEQKPGDQNFKKEHILQGLEVAKSALALNDKHFAAHKWYAIMLSSAGDFLSTNEKIGNAYKIKEHALKALELKPDDATTTHLLGRWCFGVANIGWLERKVAQTLFASPPTSSYEEALGYFQKAQELDPTFIRNAIFAADTYVAMKQSDKAREWYQKALSIPAATEVDKALHADAQRKLSKL